MSKAVRLPVFEPVAGRWSSHFNSIFGEYIVLVCLEKNFKSSKLPVDIYLLPESLTNKP